MDNRILTRQPLQPSGRVQQQKNAERQKQTDGSTSFRDVLKTKLKNNSNIDFSKHAQNRLISRGIKISESDLSKLNDGVAKAADKGSRDSLIMVNNVAYVVSIENKTVITAIDDKSLQENVFTNIDSAVFM